MDMATFWSGVGAVGTLIAAASFIVFWRADREQAARAQAGRVAAAISDWYSLSPEDRADLEPPLDPSNSAYVVVCNFSDAPIFLVRVEALDIEAEPINSLDVLLPGNRFVVDADPGLLPRRKNTSTGVRITFTLDGIDWQHERSTLSRVDPPGWLARALGR